MKSLAQLSGSLKGWGTRALVASEQNLGKWYQASLEPNGGCMDMHSVVREVWLGERSRKNTSLPGSWQMVSGTFNDFRDTHVTNQNQA